MYRKPDEKQFCFYDFILPFGGHLDGKNRWVLLSQLIPWESFEAQYAGLFDERTGAPAKPFRTALGALLIKERLRITDEETVEQIRENPYLQFFIGGESFTTEAPFEASMMVHFRKRITSKMLQDINEEIIRRAKDKNDGDGDAGDGDEHSNEESSPREPDEQKPENKGKLLIDATCAPADIRYPTDLNLVNEAREKSEKIIDELFCSLSGKEKKPRTYRNRARKEYLELAKMRKKGSKRIRKTMRRQIGYLERNLKSIGGLSQRVSLESLSAKQYRDLLVIGEVHRQQKQMFENRTHTVSGRIVSISKPHIRPIVRGKTNANVEFGAKLTISVVDGYVYQEKLSWDAYHEGKDLTEHVEGYKKRFGYYPEAVLADKIYQNRENRAFCKEHGIRMSGPALGRPSKDKSRYNEQKKQQRQDEIDRIPVEGKFGNAKRRYSLGRIMAKRRDASETTIGLILVLMNLERVRVQSLFGPFFFFLISTIRDVMRRIFRSEHHRYLAV
ncbi:MAG: IS5 family transposase [Spirochaetota bacterium]